MGGGKGYQGIGGAAGGGTPDNTSEGQIPVKRGGAFEDSAIRETEGDIESDKNLVAPTASIKFADALILKSNSDSVEIFDCARDENHDLIIDIYDDFGSGPPFQRQKQGISILDLQILDDDQNGDFSVIAAAVDDIHLEKLIVKPKTAGAGIFSIIDSVTGCILNTKTQVIFSVGQIDTEVEVVLDNPIILFAGQLIVLNYTGSDIAGHNYISDPTWGTQFVPFARTVRQIFITKNLALEEDLGDHWISGLEVTEHSPKDQTVDYTAGNYTINGTNYTLVSGDVYDMEDAYGSVDHYSGMIDSQHRFIAVYVDVDEVVKSVEGPIEEKEDVPELPVIPVDSICMALLELKVDKNDLPKDIPDKEITDCRNSTAFNTDEFVKVSADDQLSGHLIDKLSNNGNVTFTVENVGAVETIKADAAGGSGILPSIDYTTSANIDGLDVSSIAPQGILRIAAGTNIEIRSFVGGVDKQMIAVMNLGTDTVICKHQSGTNQQLRSEGSADKTFGDYGGCTLIYHAATGYWYVTGIIV